MNHAKTQSREAAQVFGAVILGVVAALAITACSASKADTHGAMAKTPEAPDPVAERLDSLVAVSNGDYIHMEISQCFGRCEASISLFRGSPAEFHIYDAQGWLYNEFQRSDIFYKLRRPITSDRAEELIRKAGDIGIMRLVNDTTYRMTDQPYIWVRARIGSQVVAVNHAYLGGDRYISEGRGKGLSDVYVNLRRTLLGPLFGSPEALDGGK